jgi:hypothetical protein
MYWSGVQSTGAEIKKYFTTVFISDRSFMIDNDGDVYSQLSTCCRATWASWGKLCCASLLNMKVSGFCGGAIVA